MRMLCYLCLGLFPLLAYADPTADLALVTQQFRANQLAANAAIPPVEGYLATLRADGSWPDIDYRSPQRANWPTGRHLTRVLHMTVALQRGNGDVALSDAIHRALGYWIQQDPQCPNWWYNQIGGPQTMLTLALLLGDELRPNEYAYITEKMLPRSKIGMTGQNRVWLAGNTLMGGLLRKDPASIQQAARVIFSEITVTTQEGIQPDFSFHQHGPQHQFGNYGLAFANEMTKWAEILRGSSWAIAPDKLEVLRQYLLNGENWIVWRGKMDISCCGRQLSPGSPEAKSNSLMRVMTAMTRIDPAHAAAYTAALRRNTPTGVNDLVGSRYYWRSDFLVHRRPDFYASLKMSSQRVIGAESMNSENLSGYYLGDGALYLYRTGEEYREIFPVWNWRRLPGVTCAQAGGKLPKFTYNRVDSTFVGGVTDGVNSVAAMAYRRDGVSAKKTTFFAGDLIVCLGAGIRAEDTVADPIATTINQCRLRGPVRARVGHTEQTMLPDAAPPDTLAWVEHDGIRYVFPQPQRVAWSFGPQTGNWRKVRELDGDEKADLTMDVFSLWIDHGTRPESAGYAYYIEPTAAARAAQVALLSNTEAVQAVRVGASLVQAVFYAGGTLEYAPGHTMTVSAPCVLLLDTAARRLAVADPAHALTTLTVTVDGKAYDLALPQGEKGKTHTVDL